MSKFLENNPNANWSLRINEIVREDPVLGGAGGPVNVPHQQLADRSEFLRRELNTMKETFSHAVGNFNVGDLHARINTIDMTLEAIQAALAGGGASIEAIAESLGQIFRYIEELKAQIAAPERQDCANSLALINHAT